MNDGTSVAAPVAKAVSAWALVGITSWSDFAAMLAALYTLLLIGEWIYKKLAQNRAAKKENE